MVNVITLNFIMLIVIMLIVIMLSEVVIKVMVPHSKGNHLLSVVHPGAMTVDQNGIWSKQHLTECPYKAAPL
jgi:hypothetical protein